MFYSTQIYDIEIFKQHLAYAIQKGEFDEMALQRLSVVSLSFVRNTFDDHKTPCWISVLNFCALDMLGNKYGALCIQEDVCIVDLRVELRVWGVFIKWNDISFYMFFIVYFFISFTLVLDDMIKNYNIKLNASEDYQLKVRFCEKCTSLG